MQLDWLNRQTKSREAFKACFGTEEGKAVLHQLVKDHFVFKTTPTPDPYLAAWQEGQRALVLKIMEMTDTDLSVFRRRYEQMETERVNNRNR